jgi:hypothetical protein
MSDDADVGNFFLLFDTKPFFDAFLALGDGVPNQAGQFSLCGPSTFQSVSMSLMSLNFGM